MLFFNIQLEFKTDNGVFSKNQIDEGSYYLASTLSQQEFSSLLDLGCGYGFIGIALAKTRKLNLEMMDINPRCIKLSKENLKLNQVEANLRLYDFNQGLDQTYDNIALNPPIAIGKEKLYQLYLNIYQNLNINGNLYLVIKKKHGALSTIDYLNKINFKTEVLLKKKGYLVIKASK